MVSKQNKALLRAFADTFPALKIALQINDCICYVVNSLLHYLCSLIKCLFKLVLSFISKFFTLLIKYIPALDYKSSAHYERLRRKGARQHDEPVPYENRHFKRILTYHFSLILGVFLYIFVYYVLVKHTTYFTVAIGLLLMLAYLLVLENSHNIRSIIMLCLPIMFTNRGRALVFCCMLAIMVSGPLKNSQKNIGELHSSITCCRQYLIIKTDKFVDRNIVQSLMRVEDILDDLVGHIRKFAQQLKERFKNVLQLAITVERYLENSIEKLKRIVNFCNENSDKVYNNCQNTFAYAYNDCMNKLGAIGLLCEIVRPLKELCNVVRIPESFCKIPKEVVYFIDRTIGKRLRSYLEIMENEFYFEFNIGRQYSYNATKTKTFNQTIEEIKSDIEHKFWYVHLVNRVFNLLSLILVVWIITTATLYQMHYLTELDYDNMYIDGYLKEIENIRKEKHSRDPTEHLVGLKSVKDITIDETDRTLLQQNSLLDNSLSNDDEPVVDGIEIEKANRELFLFPIPELQARKYPKPFSLWMNDEERHKLCLAGLIWAVIVGYIFFYVLLDFSLFKLIELIQETLRDILFTSELPIVDISSKTGDKEIRYNRTHLHQLRAKLKLERLERGSSHGNKSLSGIYRKLMDSMEENIPDDVAILDSVELCLPKPSSPNYANYKNLLYLAMFTFGAVILEAYALRTRHCIANLYYPKWARKRAVWFYRKLLKERPKFSVPEELEKDAGTQALEHGLKLLADRIKR